MSSTTRARLRTAFVVLAVGVTGILLVVALAPSTTTLKASAGSTKGRRHQVLTSLAEAAEPRQVHLELIETEGSLDALERVSRGELDVALVQGGLDPIAHVQLAATLLPEPLHLFAVADIASVADLRGRDVNLGPSGSGTHDLASRVVRFAGLEPGEAFTVSELSYGAIEAADATLRLPDAVFTVSLLPSPVGEVLVQKHGYHLVPVPYAAAMTVRDPSLDVVDIPAYTYAVEPPTPDVSVVTVAPSLLLVAGEHVSARVVYRLLTAVYEGHHRGIAGLDELDEATLGRSAELPLHLGAERFAARNLPMFTSGDMEGIESLRSFLVSIGVTLFLVWRWLGRRRHQAVSDYLAQVTAAERELQSLERHDPLPVDALRAIRVRLSAVKADALDRFGKGEIRDEEGISTFLAHVADARNQVNALLRQSDGTSPPRPPSASPPPDPSAVD